jgi:RNA polymerase sigma-70 factor (ECF subfamily)
VGAVAWDFALSDRLASAGGIKPESVSLLAVADAPECVADAHDAARLEKLVRAEFAYIWRLCRRLGLPKGDADDALQQVFLTASRRLHDVKPGSERAFLYGVAVNVAAKWRQAHARRREDLESSFEIFVAGLPNAEELLDQQAELRVLDALLDAMPDDLRTVFVLHEIEQQPAPRIAEALGIAAGTVASRLRRAREDFSARLARLRARRRFEGNRK